MADTAVQTEELEQEKREEQTPEQENNVEDDVRGNWRVRRS